MIEHTISEIETRVRNLATMDGRQRQDLLALLEKLKTEAGGLEPAHGPAARALAESLESSAHAATATPSNPAAVQTSAAGLRASVEGFEQSHPGLVEVVNRLSHMLANLGF